jgi:hypothetical protein
VGTKEIASAGQGLSHGVCMKNETGWSLRVGRVVCCRSAPRSGSKCWNYAEMQRPCHSDTHPNVHDEWSGVPECGEGHGYLCEY